MFFGMDYLDMNAQGSFCVEKFDVLAASVVHVYFEV